MWCSVIHEYRRKYYLRWELQSVGQQKSSIHHKHHRKLLFPGSANKSLEIVIMSIFCDIQNPFSLLYWIFPLKRLKNLFIRSFPGAIWNTCLKSDFCLYLVPLTRVGLAIPLPFFVWLFPLPDHSHIFSISGHRSWYFCQSLCVRFWELQSHIYYVWVIGCLTQQCQVSSIFYLYRYHSNCKAVSTVNVLK